MYKQKKVIFGVITFVFIILSSILLTIFINLIITPKESLFHRYIDYLFFLNAPILLISCIMFIQESGAFNSIGYSTALIRSRLSTKYKHELMTSAEIDANEISNHLKDTYLHRQIHYTYTYSLLLPSAIIFIGLMVYVIAIY